MQYISLKRLEMISPIVIYSPWYYQTQPELLLHGQMVLCMLISLSLVSRLFPLKPLHQADEDTTKLFPHLFLGMARFFFLVFIHYCTYSTVHSQCTFLPRGHFIQMQDFLLSLHAWLHIANVVLRDAIAGQWPEVWEQLWGKAGLDRALAQSTLRLCVGLCTAAGDSLGRHTRHHGGDWCSPTCRSVKTKHLLKYMGAILWACSTLHLSITLEIIFIFTKQAPLDK